MRSLRIAKALVKEAYRGINNKLRWDKPSAAQINEGDDIDSQNMQETYPKELLAVFDAVSQKLGREAFIRKVKNRNEYYVLDIAFSHFQVANRNKQKGYRAGYTFFYGKGYNNLGFEIVHSPIMFSFFQKNFDYNRFRELVERTHKYRTTDYLSYVLFNKSRDHKERFVIDKLKTPHFLKELDSVEEKYGFAKTIFASKNASLKDLGNTFYVKLADNISASEAFKIINDSWDLFMWLYPSKPLFKRDASLNRSMQKIERKCEFRAIQGLPQEILDAECDGIVQAAHIKPHHKGGSDKLTNGLWLCEKHHRMTEGKLTGSRDLEHIDVKFRP